MQDQRPDLVVGAVSVHRIIDMDPFAAPVDMLLPGADLAALAGHQAMLSQGHVDFARGELLLAVQSHLVRVGGKTILIDTCVGEMKHRPRRPNWHERTDTGYLDRLAAAGCRCEDVDLVLCTHLHADHVGWNTQLRDGRWVPTFPNARYVVSGVELDHAQAEVARDPQAHHGSYRDSVLPIVTAGLFDRVAPGDRFAPGTELVALPGHSPGQMGLSVGTGTGRSLLFCGDAVHSPAQVVRPDWSSAFCCDPVESAATRAALLDRVADADVVLVPAHLRGAGLRIRRDGNGFRPVPCGCDGALPG
jgi:glyoxylase-like metal-dependent hydrolase (beta-lactamase superfamily II)